MASFARRLNARLARRRRLGHSIVLLSGLLIAGSAINTLISLEHGYRQVTAQTAESLAGVARAVEADTNREISEIDTVLSRIERVLDAPGAAIALDGPAAAAVLRDSIGENPLVADILIIDPAGRVLGSAAGGHGGEVSARGFFKALRDNPPAGLSIGPPEPGRAGTGWSIMLSRKLVRGAGAAGTIAAEVPSANLVRLFSAFVGGDSSHVALLFEDGSLVAGDPGQPYAIGARPAFAAALLAAAAHREAGVLAWDEAGDAAMRAYRRLPARPLVTTVSRDRAEILDPWYAQCATSLAALAVFVLTAGGLTWLVVRTLQRQQLAAARQRRSEKRLERERALLQSTLENLGEGLSVFSRSGRLIAWNSRFGELLDLPDLSVGTQLRDIMMLQARRGDFGEVDPETETAERLVRFFRDLPRVHERTTTAGRVLQIRRRAMPSGGAITIYSDVTEIRAFERELVQARIQAEVANRSKSEFLANMSHELRTPLNAVIGFSEIIANQIFGAIGNAKYLEYIGDIHSSSLHLLSIINDVLDMSKIEAGKLELSVEQITVQSVIEDAVRMMHERAKSRGIALRREVPEQPLVMVADARAMKQIILNLVSNAIKFSGDGGRVTLRAAAADEHVILEIQDFGVGMSEEEQARALQPFGQAKAGTTRAYGGTGLGLPITKGLVEAHGGSLTIESRVGVGTTVRITLPLETGRGDVGESPMLHLATG